MDKWELILIAVIAWFAVAALIGVCVGKAIKYRDASLDFEEGEDE